MHTHLSAIIVRAMKDPEFKEQLIKDPKQVLAQWNISIPASSEVTILQQSLEKVYLVLPHPGVIDKLQSKKEGPKTYNPLESIIIRAVKDPKFKHELIKNSKKILERECDIELPEHCKSEVVEETENKFYIVIPYAPNPGELSDKELAEIAAGGSRVYRFIGCLEPFGALGES